MKLYIYCLDPIDDWAGWTSISNMLSNGRGPSDGDELYYESKWQDVIGVVRRWRAAARLAKKIGWEGDFRNEILFPAISPLPTGFSGDGGEYLIGWKQDNNGSTFIASPYPLSWLSDAMVLERIVGEVE
jgi:hypothetical protein